MDGGVLSKNIVVPNFEERRDPFIGSGLGISSYYSTLRELIVLPDFGPLSYGDVRLQYASFTNLCPCLDVRKWSDDHVVGKFRTRVNKS